MGRAPTDTKQKLIATATDLIWLNSYGSVSVDEICKTTGVKKGSFYHYFPSKSDLAIASIDACYEEAAPIYNDIFSPTRPALERFEMLAQHMYKKQEHALERYGRVCGCPFATLGSELAAQDETIRARVEFICKRHLAYYENALRDLIVEGLLSPQADVSTKAEELYAYLLGQMMMARIQNSTRFLKEHLRDGMYTIIGVQRQAA